MFKLRREKGQSPANAGQSLVEVAIAMPLLIVILVGILDLGRAYFTYVALTDAAAEGAAYAAIHPTQLIQIVERAADNSNGLVMLEPGNIHVATGSLSAGSPITVSVNYDYDVLTPIIQTFVPDGVIRMRATVAQSIISD
jgi:Flp pilus assembly protein TadG